MSFSLEVVQRFFALTCGELNLILKLYKIKTCRLGSVHTQSLSADMFECMVLH